MQHEELRTSFLADFLAVGDLPFILCVPLRVLLLLGEPRNIDILSLLAIYDKLGARHLKI